MKIVNNVVDWLDERTGLKEPIIRIATHLCPPGAKWAYVFGTAVMTAFMVQLASGVALATVYVPSASQAYESIQFITTKFPFGNLVRAMHYWGASAMILMAVVHMIQVYLWGSYKYPRELNWLSGVALLLFTVGMGFTGQVLRWDQNAVWTIAVGSEQAMRAPFIGKYLVQVLESGQQISSASLTHFFALHVFLIPGLLIAGIGLHVFLVLKHGISEPPVVGEPVDPRTYKQKYHALMKKTGRPFWPDAAWRDIVFSTIVVLAIFACALAFGAPKVETPPDPSLVHAAPKPDWYLLWYFALLALLPHAAEDYIIILFPALVITGLFAVPFINNKGERHMFRRPWAIGLVVFCLSSIAALWRLGVTEPWSPKFKAVDLPQKNIGATSGPVFDGAKVFNDRGCLYCHMIDGHGGQRGPDLSDVADRLTDEQLKIRIVNGGYNMPAYAGNLSAKELADVLAFLETRKK